ncbi:hypothetical protein D3C71_1518260 [compost metagenome]
MPTDTELLEYVTEPAPNAMLLVCVAFAPLPMALLWAPLAREFTPAAKARSPLALLLCPVAVAYCPAALAPEPTASVVALRRVLMASAVDCALVTPRLVACSCLPVTASVLPVLSTPLSMF